MLTRFLRIAAAPFVLAVLSLFVAASPVAAQSSTGSVAGRVTDAASGAPLVGADVTLDGTSLTTATDRTGAFRLTGVPGGHFTLVIQYLGHEVERSPVTVTTGRILTVDVTLRPSQFSETVDVRAEPIGDGQARALNQQRTAPNIANIISADQIGSFPDPNAAEAASRVPGVSIARDQGEGRYVLVRGTEARLNAMMIDGERLPSPEGDARSVALDAVPADQLQSIEVSKAVTPDMDADSIGGSVNLITKQAVSRPVMLLAGATGYNRLQDDFGQGQASGTFGRRFADGKVGLLVGGSAMNLHRGSENFEAEYADGDLDDLQLRDYIIKRERYGLNASGDARLSDTSLLSVRGIFNTFQDYEVNNRIRYNVGSDRIERVLKNRQQDQRINSISGGGQHVLPQGMLLDYRLGWARAQEHQPDRLDTIFRQSGVTFAPNVSANSIDPENIQPNPLNDDINRVRLNAQESEIFLTRDRDVTGSFNLRMPLRAGGRIASFLKAGVKIKDKHKDRAYDLLEAAPGRNVPFSELEDPSFDSSGFLSFFPAGYTLGPGINPAAARAFYNALPASAKELNHESDAQDYDADERVYAGYVMAELYSGDRLLILPGLRYEATRVRYTGYDVLYNDDGDYESTQPVTGGDTYGFLLPGLHVRYAIDPSTNLRAAYTRTLARPNYYDLVPYELVFQEDSEISRGNPALKPTTSNNLDLLLERYFKSVGVISGGVFFKRLSDYIYPFRVREPAFGDVYEITQPRNGDSASLWGLELAFQNQLRFLPGPLDGFGVYANYTWTDSSAQFPDREDTDSPLPGQSKHLGNIALWYEKYGFSARSSWNFHGKYIDAVGETAREDVFYDNHVQWDVNVSQRLTKNLRVYADALNLTNAPLRYYIGSPNRPIQEEYYRWWMMFGVKANF